MLHATRVNLVIFFYLLFISLEYLCADLRLRIVLLVGAAFGFAGMLKMRRDVYGIKLTTIST